jgi:mannose-6-phosphate isomerase-like protein (cupin superfamily)
VRSSREEENMPTVVRRVVTGIDAAGRSAVREDTRASRFYELDRLGGMSATAIWEVQTPLTDVMAGGDPPEGPLTVQPPPGAVRVFRFVLPPDSSIDEDQNAIIAEITERLPSLLEAVDPEREFGMHRTETIDILYVVSGAMDLILETGKTSLATGDAVVQLGTWHSWRNPYSEPCVAIVTMLRRT